MGCHERSRDVRNHEALSELLDATSLPCHRRSQPRQDEPSRNELNGSEVGADGLAQATGREVAW